MMCRNSYVLVAVLLHSFVCWWRQVVAIAKETVNAAHELSLVR